MSYFRVSDQGFTPYPFLIRVKILSMTKRRRLTHGKNSNADKKGMNADDSSGQREGAGTEHPPALCSFISFFVGYVWSATTFSRFLFRHGYGQRTLGKESGRYPVIRSPRQGQETRTTCNAEKEETGRPPRQG